MRPASSGGMMSPEAGDPFLDDDGLDEASLVESSLMEETAASMRPGDRIWVGIRIRPQSDREREARDKPVWEGVQENGIKYSGTARNQTSKTTWQFDRVFDAKSDSDEVYRDCAQSVVKASMEGYHGTVFAYGQSGSGKTYTMRAMLKAAGADIFDHIRKTPGREFTLRLSAVEIYNEVVRDMLQEETPTLRIMDDPQRGTVVEGLHEEPLTSARNLTELIAAAEPRRTVAETGMNQHSSRSHLVVRLTIESRPREDAVEPHLSDSFSYDHSIAQATYISTLNFVDLAGSERASKTGAEGIRHKEGCHINRSLLSLGTVIRKLAAGAAGSHVPYRDSKLTRLLAHSLGGNAKTAVVCCLSPAASAAEQSRATLLFASHAKRVVNCAEANAIVDDKTLIRQYQAEIAGLRAQLSRALEERAAAGGRQSEATEEMNASLMARLAALEKFLLCAPRPEAAAVTQSADLTTGLAARRRRSWSPERASWPTPKAKFPRLAGLDHVPEKRVPVSPKSQFFFNFEATQRKADHPEHGSPSARVLFPADTFAPGSGGPLPLLSPTAGSNGRLSGTPASIAKSSKFAAARSLLSPSRYADVDDDDALVNVGGDTPGACPEPLAKQIEMLEGGEGGGGTEAGKALADELCCLRTLSKMSHSDALLSDPAAAAASRLEAAIRKLEGEQQRGAAGVAAAEAEAEASDEVDETAGRARVMRLLRKEVDRLKSRERTQQDVSSALSILQRNLGSMRTDLDKYCGDYLGNVLKASYESAAGSLDPRPSEEGGDPRRSSVVLLGSPRSRHTDKEGHESTVELADKENSPPVSWPPNRAPVSHNGSTGSQLSAMVPRADVERERERHQEEVRKLQETFAEVAQQGEKLTEALTKYADEVTRIEWQKKRLMAQVLVLEAKAEEHRRDAEATREALEEERRRRAATPAASQAALALPPIRSPIRTPRPQSGCGDEWDLSGTPNMNDSWAGPPTAAFFTPKIVRLWSALNIPLLHRSRFYLGFRGRETFYYEAEHRRLCWLQATLAPSGAPCRGHPLVGAEAALIRERADLAKRMRTLTDEEREAIYTQWGVDASSKARKRQVIAQLWANGCDAAMRRASSVLILKLHRIDPDKDDMLSTVFSGPSLTPLGGWLGTA